MGNGREQNPLASRSNPVPMPIVTPQDALDSASIVLRPANRPGIASPAADYFGLAQK
jgi:hypothetical protein